MTERVASGTNPLSLAALDSSPEGRALGRTSKFRPHQSTVRRSQPISEELPAPAKASPFRERWHGEAVTERVVSRTNPFRHFALRNATSPEGGGLGKEGRSRPHPSTAGRRQPISGKLFASAKASPFRERWHGEAVTERVVSKTPSRRLQQEAAAGASHPLQTQKARQRVLQRAFDGSCGVAALSAAQQCLTPDRPGPGWWNARSPSLPHGGCPRYGAWPPGSSLP